MDQAGAASKRQREAAAVGQGTLDFGPPPAPKTQVELIRSATERAPNPDAARQLQSLSNTVTELSKLPEENLSVALNRGIEKFGVEHPEVAAIRLAIAQKRQGFVPTDAPVKNVLPRATKGVDLAEPGPNNPFEMRAMQEDVFSNLRANGGMMGRTKAAELEELNMTTREMVARARGRGEELAPEQLQNILRRQEQIMGSAEVSFASEDHAFRVAQRELGKTVTASDIDAFVENAPVWYAKIQPRLLQAAKDRKSILAEVERDARPLKALLDRQPQGFKELMAEASDSGMAVMPRQNVPPPGGKPRISLEAVELNLQGQTVKNFRNVEKARDWIRELQAGTVEPRNIHELRALGFGRGLVVDHTGRGSVDVTNQLTGETVQGITSMAEAVRVVRQAPNLTATAREIGPRVGAHPPLPGTGGIGGLATEQPPPFCPLLDVLV